MSEREWVWDFNYKILKDNKHWFADHSDDPSEIGADGIHKQWRRNLSFNTSINLFDEDPGSAGDRSKTSFLLYYESPIYDVLTKFAYRLDTLPWDKTNTLSFEEERFIKRNVEPGQAAIRAAAIVSSHPLNKIPMRHLYTTEFYDHIDTARQALLDLLAVLDGLKTDMRWMCVPFLYYPRVAMDPKDESRPGIPEYLHHVGYPPGQISLPPTLPGGTPAGPLLALGAFTFREFCFYHGNSKAEKDAHENARNFALEWGFFDKADINDRHFSNVTGSGGIKILSSGNGYKCDGASCKPSNASSFCVSTSCP